MDPQPPASPTDPAAVVAHFEARARRVETPCGDGVMVWRAWGAGPPVVLAHGSHGAWSHWIRTIDALAEHRTVWAPDLPANGDSALPPAPEGGAIAEVLAAGLAQVVGPDAPVDIVGFSFGGVACAYLAAHRPEMVRRLVLVGTGGLDTPLGHVELTRVRGLEGEARRAAHRFNLLGLMLHSAEAADDLAIHLNELNGPRGRLNPSSLVLPDKLIKLLPEVRAQVDAIWGAFDRPHPNPAVQEAALRAVDPAIDFRVIAAAGHWAMYEQPAAFNRTVLEMLDTPLRR